MISISSLRRVSFGFVKIFLYKNIKRKELFIHPRVLVMVLLYKMRIGKLFNIA